MSKVTGRELVYVRINTGQWTCLQLDELLDFSVKPQNKFIRPSTVAVLSLTQ